VVTARRSSPSRRVSRIATPITWHRRLLLGKPLQRRAFASDLEKAAGTPVVVPAVDAVEVVEEHRDDDVRVRSHRLAVGQFGLGVQRFRVDQVTVGRGDSRVRFSLGDVHPRPPHLVVVLIVPGLTAEMEVTEHYMSGFDDLASYFEGLAQDWRGWSGARSWTSVEHDLHLVAEHDRVGHVSLTVNLRREIPRWRAEGTVSIDAGEDLIAAAAGLVDLVTTYRTARANL